MGGEIFVGIRHTINGPPEEVLMERWTNDFPWRFMLPSFLKQGEELKRFIAEARADHKWPESRLVKTVNMSEYGLVLIDFPSKEVLSRNDYCTAGTNIVSAIHSSFDEEIKGVRELAELGWIGKIEEWPINGEKKEQTLKHFLLKLRTGSTRSYSQWTIHLSAKVMKIDSFIDRRPKKAFVNKWLAEHGWKARII